MPTWLVHGFRWPRQLLRIHIILHNVEDAATEWLMAPGTQEPLLDSLRKEYPKEMIGLDSLRFIEQYDPEDMYTKSAEYAFVCDQVHEIKLSVDIDEIRGKGIANDTWSKLADLRDRMAPGEKLGWFVVVNGDVERWAPPVEENEEDDEDTIPGSTNGSQISPVSQRSSVGRIEEDEDSDRTQREKPRGLKKWFGKARRSKSSKDLKGDMAMRPKTAPTSPGQPPPPVPPMPRNGLTASHGPPVPPQKGVNGKAPVAAGTAV